MENLKSKPIVYQVEDNNTGLVNFESRIQITESMKVQDVILNYPTVYIHTWENSEGYEVYIGESNNIIQRTKQHYADARKKGNWQNALLKNNANLFIIGHEHFNKSLTLDIENRLIMYMMSVSHVKKIHNQKANPQNKYYTENELDNIFQQIWKQLRKKDAKLFPAESYIKDSAVFKASPLHKLTSAQESAKEIILQKIFVALSSKAEKQLIFVEGETGTGKTVLNSSTFYEVFEKAEEQEISSIQCCLIVNHNEQIKVYEQIAQRLGLTDKYGEVVCKPTHFINKHSIENPIDVAFIDEAHLLLTQGNQSYKGNNQLQDIIDRARVTVVMFDENQILTTEQVWEANILEKFRCKAIQGGNYIELKDQLRMMADKETINWVDEFTKHQNLHQIPYDSAGYEIRIFENPEDLDFEIQKKANSKETALSRLVATYDWEYNPKPLKEDRLLKYWEVLIGKWHKPWNYELERNMGPKEKRNIKTLSWAEQPQTIEEVGSTFTIQGFDLSYVGVILGPSVRYKNRKIIFDPSESYSKKAVRKRTLLNGTKKEFGKTLLQHEVRVLMTRGVKGLYIYACDENLRNALLDMVSNSTKGDNQNG